MTGLALTETAIKGAKPKDKPYMLQDDRGLWLLIVPGGGKYWRLRYWVGGKEKKVSLGTYPSVTPQGGAGAAGQANPGSLHREVRP